MPDSIFEAFKSQNWYALAALLLFGAIAFLKNAPLGQALWSWLDQHQLRWLVPCVLAFSTGFTGAFFEGKVLGVALVSGVGAVLWIGLPAMGLHGALRDSPLPYIGSSNKQE